MNPQTNYYQVLGISESASTDEIKRAYRQMAKQYHPDSSGGDKAAEEKFKQIGEAYSILSDSQKRSKYDMLRRSGYSNMGPGGFNPGAPGGYRTQADNIQDIFSNLFGPNEQDGGFNFNIDDFFNGPGPGTQSRGTDMESTITIPFEMSINGGETIIKTGSNKKVKIKIPEGTDDGKKIRIRGHGAPAVQGGPPGDLYLIIKIAPHPEFERRGNDIHSHIYINVAEAILGTELQVKTVSGKFVKLKIPPGTSSAKIFRLPGMGVKTTNDQGDHYVRIEIDVPPNLTLAHKREFKTWARKVGMLK